MKIIKKDLILTEDTTFNESIKVEGNIKGTFKLFIVGDIDAWDIDVENIDARDIDACNIDAWDINARDIDACNIDACNIDAWDINARDIDACNIDAWDINARDIIVGDIDAWDIICEKRIKKTKTAKTKCRIYITEKSKIKYEEKDELAGKDLI